MKKKRTTLVLARHGNAEKINPSISDVMSAEMARKLSEKGQGQAERLGTRVNHIRFDRVFSSPAVRAMQTMLTVLMKNTHHPIPSPDFIRTLWPDEKWLPICDAAFKKLQYAPLSVYEQELGVAEELAEYYDTNIRTIESFIGTKLFGEGERDLTILVTAHAVCMPSLAANILRNAESHDKASLELALSVNLGEACALVVTVDEEGHAMLELIDVNNAPTADQVIASSTGAAVTTT
ncbi:MAG: phosphoglycerate mutase family protein [Candidatus Paceibacterota bacterium]